MTHVLGIADRDGVRSDDRLGIEGHRLVFEPLAIENDSGFPQEVSHRLDDATYRLWLYVNLASAAVTDDDQFFDLPAKGGHLTVRVTRQSGASERLLFLRKVVPGVRYVFENVVLEFPHQRVARSNLGGAGEQGSQVVGRIARRWA